MWVGRETLFAGMFMTERCWIYGSVLTVSSISIFCQVTLINGFQEEHLRSLSSLPPKNNPRMSFFFILNKNNFTNIKAHILIDVYICVSLSTKPPQIFTFLWTWLRKIYFLSIFFFISFLRVYFKFLFFQMFVITSFVALF